MTAAQRAARLVAQWRQRRETGAQETAADLLHAHPGLAAELRLHLDLQQLLEGVAPAKASPGIDPGPPLRERIGDFRLLREIGRGGMGVVYEAEQISMRRPVALKVLVPEVSLSPKAVERFRREAQAAGRLHHTNIVAVYGMGEDDGVLYYAMEQIKGRTLAAVIADLNRLGARPPSPDPSDPSSWVSTGGTGRAFFTRAASAFAGVADALEHAHAAGIVHRDVKPSNVMLDSEGVLKLTDFGLARVEEGSHSLTMAGDVLGTPAYMSPEQIRPGAQALDARADVYSLGATLYEFLALRPPFQGATPQELFARILSEDARPPRRWNPRIPKDLDTIVCKAMERNPARRYQTAAEFADDLRHFAEGGAIRARRAGPVARAWRKVRRHRVLFVAGLLVLCAGTATGLLAQRASREESLRVTLEYDDLVRRAEVGLAARWSRERVVRGKSRLDVRSLLARAIALAPGRPEAYLVRLLGSEGPLEECLADADAARARGVLTARGHLLARSWVLRERGRSREANEAFALAGAELPFEDPVTRMLEARHLTLGGEAEAALARLSLSDPEGSEAGLIHYLFLVVRADAQERIGDWHGAIETLAGLGAGLGADVRVRIASLWRRAGAEEHARALMLAVVADVERSGSESGWLSLCNDVHSYWEGPQAIETTQRALDANPRSSSLWCVRAEVLLEEGGDAQLVEGLAAAVEAARLDARSSLAASLQANALTRLGRADEALPAATRALELDPESAERRAEHARSVAQAGSAEEGLAALRRLVDEDPAEIAYVWNLVEALRSLRLYGEALPYAERAVAISPGPATLLVLAYILEATQRYEEALVVTQRALTLAPEHARSHNRLGHLLRKLDRLREALESFDRSLALNSHDGKVHAHRALCLNMLGRSEEALASIDTAIAEGGAEHVGTLGCRVEILAALGRSQDALDAADRAIACASNGDDPADQVLAWHVHTGVLRALGRWQEALDALPAVELDGVGAAAWRRLTLMCDLSRHEDAIAYASALRAKGGNALLSLAIECLALRGLRRADEARQLAATASMTDVPFSASYAAAYLCALSGRHAEAQKLIDAYVPLSPDGGSRFMASVACAVLGDRERALTLLADAVKRGYRCSPGGGWTRELAVLEDDPRYRSLLESMTLK